MKIISENGKIISSPKEKDIRDSWEQLNLDADKFFILEQSKSEFIQCANTEEGKVIEYHHNGQSKHLRYYIKYSDENLIMDILTSFSQNRKVDETNVNWESFSIKEKGSLINTGSRVFFWLGSITFLAFIWEYKINENDTGVFWGIKVLYLMTMIFVLLAIGFISDFNKWDKLRMDSKAYAIGSVTLALFLILLSLMTYLGYGSFAD